MSSDAKIPVIHTARVMEERQTFDTVQLSMKKNQRKSNTNSKLFLNLSLKRQNCKLKDTQKDKTEASNGKSKRCERWAKPANIEIYSEENVNWPPLYSFRSDRRRLFNLVAVQTKPNSKVNLEQLPNNNFHLCSFYN